MNVGVRPAKPDDLDSLVNVDHVAQQDTRRADFIKDAIGADQCAVAETSDRVVGFIVVSHHFFGHDFVDLLYVATEHRRCGIGGTLMAYAEAGCEAEKLFTSTNLSNRPMQFLLAKCGYVLSGYIDKLDQGDPELVYMKRIKRPTGGLTG
jgi:ribosomal protein S18 acetylase RimI-like enzyme